MDKAAVDPKSVKKGNSHACEKKRRKKKKRNAFWFFYVLFGQTRKKNT